MFIPRVNLFTKYSPPFTYSYQCSSALLVNYSSVFVYMFLAVFLWALIKLGVLGLGDGCPSYLRWIIYIDPASGKSTFNLPVYVSTCMCYMVILLTFGVTYPPLGVVICVTVFLDTSVTQHVVGETFVLEGEGSARMLSVITKIIYFVPLFSRWVRYCLGWKWSLSALLAPSSDVSRNLSFVHTFKECVYGIRR